MTASSPTSRQERCKQLCKEIDELNARYFSLPPGRAQDACQAEIDSRFRQIDELNAEQDAEDKAQAEAQAENSSGRGWSPYPGIGIALIMILIGLITSAYTVVLIGGIAMLVSVSALVRSSSADQETPERERFQWRP